MASSPEIMRRKSSIRSRIGGQKVRSACRTCKARHIKCDEAKPSCFRCLKSGRLCDGYGMQVTIAMQARESLLSSPDVHSYRSEKENRGFDYFRDTALSELMGFDTKSDFWSHVVLQFSEASPAVFRAVLSLSSLHETTYGQAIQSSVENKMTFLRQYNKAIRQICSRQTEQPVHFTLTCCILFICVENLRECYDASLLHLENGLEILKHWHTQKVTSSEREARDIITKAFQRLDMQATTFLDSRQPQFNMSPLNQNSPLSTKKPPTFADLHHARRSLDSLVTKLFYIITTKSDPQYPPWSTQNKYLHARKTLLKGLSVEFSKWKSAFDSFSVQSQKGQGSELRLSVLLGLHHRTTTLMLDIRYDTDINGKYRGSSKTAEWTKIIDICQSMITSLSTSRFSFSSDLGLIAPLYFTAMQAENTQISQQAIDLLYQIKWKEGFWDAGTAARVAEKVLHNPITGDSGTVSTGGIAQLAKLHCVTCC